MKKFLLMPESKVTKPTKLGYSDFVQQKAVELALAGYNLQGALSAAVAVFLCVFSPRPRFLVKLEGEAFVPAGYLVSQSANPFQLCHHQLAVIGKAPKPLQGAH